MRCKRIIALAAAAALSIGLLAGCGSSGNGSKDGKKLNIAVTIFPEYDWVRQIMGSHAEDAEITFLLDNGADLHSYQPTADDIIKISDCDMFIYAGGESDSWADGALANAQNDDMQVVELLDVIGTGVKLEEVKEGMEAEEEGEEDEEDEKEYDEHVWLSVKNAKTICADIEQKLEKLDPDNAEDYKANLEKYTAELDKLDNEFAEMIKAAPVKTVLFGDRFPFRYFVDDYGLDYYAAFVGCSAETEASFETVAFLAKKVDDLKLKTVFVIESSDKKLAQTIVDNTESKDQQILTLDSLQSVTDKDKTYIDAMRSNLEELKKGLNS